MAKKALTSFVIELRKHRIERSETLYEMAEAVGISPSFLSAVETGRKRAPKELVEKVIEHLRVDMVDALKLRQMALETGPEIRIPLKGRGSEARQVAAMFARRFDDDDLSALREALEKNAMPGAQRQTGPKGPV